jgi:DNA polymerase-3 subunit delta'
MKPLLLHEHTREAIKRFMAHPGHALLLVAPPGAGKATVADYLASKLLGVPQSALANHPYFKSVQRAAGKSISISEVRDIIHFMTLRAAGSGSTTRVVVIEDAHSMTTQAQNALLKTIEEPPAGTVLILTAPDELSVLPTIRSRVQLLNLIMPASGDARAYFTADGYEASAVDKALLISGGLPGLMHALLEADTQHPLFAATTAAREILQGTTFERLILADELAKQRELGPNVLFILGQMASTALEQGRGSAAAERRWHKVLAAVHAAHGQTNSNGQAKLVLLNLMLAL